MDYHSESDTEDMECPLCMEEIDVTDKYFKPCPCGYQICRFCWNRIKEDLVIEFTPVSAEELAHIKNAKKLRERERKEMDNAARKHLANARVVQKNLVYVVGMPAKFATEEYLKSTDFFGQFGKVAKVVVNRKGHNHTSVVSTMSPTGVFVFYYKKEDAIKAIDATDGTVFDGNKVLRVTHGTTKYCQFFLKNQPCQHAICQYLHEPAEEADTYAKEELSRQAVRDRNPRPVPFPTLMAYFKKDIVEENSLPATATWAKPIGSQRPTASPIPQQSYNHLSSTPQPSDSEFSDSENPRPTHSSNLMDLIVEKKKRTKKSQSTLAIEASAFESQLESPRPCSEPRQHDPAASISPEGPPGLMIARQPESRVDSPQLVQVNPVFEESIPSLPSSTPPPSIPDENRILGSKALNDGNDELVPNLIRRGPPNSAFAVARKTGVIREKSATKSGVSLYNLGYILHPTYKGLFDPFSNDPTALIRGNSFVADEGARFSRMVDSSEDLDKRYQNVPPHLATPETDNRWVDNGTNKMLQQDQLASNQWPQQQQQHQQQQLLREQIIADNALRQQQQLLRNNQFLGGNVNLAAARQQQELLLLQQQQQQQRFQQQQYMNSSQDEFVGAFLREAQLRENQLQIRDLQMRERNAVLLNTGANTLGMKTDNNNWGATVGYESDRLGDGTSGSIAWSEFNRSWESAGSAATGTYTARIAERAGTGETSRWGSRQSRLDAVAGYAAATATTRTSVAFVEDASRSSRSSGPAARVSQLIGRRGEGVRERGVSEKALSGSMGGGGCGGTDNNDGDKNGTSQSIDKNSGGYFGNKASVVGYIPVEDEKKSKSSTRNDSPLTELSLMETAKVNAPSSMTRKEKAKQRAKEKELMRQMQRERDLQIQKEKERERAIQDKQKKREVLLNNERHIFESENQNSSLITEILPAPSKFSLDMPTASHDGEIHEKLKKVKRKAKKNLSAEISNSVDSELRPNGTQLLSEMKLDPNEGNLKHSMIEKSPNPKAAEPVKSANQVSPSLASNAMRLAEAAKTSRRKRAKERDELAAKQGSKSSQLSSSSGVTSIYPPPLPPMFLEILGKAASSMNAPDSMAGLSEQLSNFASAMNMPTSQELDALAAGPLGQFVRAQVSAYTNSRSSSPGSSSQKTTETGEISFDCEVTPDGLTKAMLAIAETFLASVEDPAAAVAANGIAFGLGFGVQQYAEFSGNSEIQFKVDPATGNAMFTAVIPKPLPPDEIKVVGNGIFFGPELPPDFSHTNGSSSKYINPFPMFHPNASKELEIDSEFGESMDDNDYNEVNDDVGRDEDLYDLDNFDESFAEENDDEYEDIDTEEYGGDLHLEDPDRAITFLNQGSTYISELLESVRWMVAKGESLINSPTHVSPEVKGLLLAMEAEYPTVPEKKPVPRRLPCQDLVDMLENEHEKCQHALKEADRELLRIIDLNRKNASDLIQRFGLDSTVLDEFCEIPLGVKYGLESPLPLSAFELIAFKMQLQSEVGKKMNELGNDTYNEEASAQMAEYILELHERKKSKDEVITELLDVIANPAEFVDWVYAYIDTEKSRSLKSTAGEVQPGEQPNGSSPSRKRPAPSDKLDTSLSISAQPSEKPTKQIKKIVWDLDSSSAEVPKVVEKSKNSESKATLSTPVPSQIDIAEQKRLRSARFGFSAEEEQKQQQKQQKQQSRVVSIVGRGAESNVESKSAISSRLGNRLGGAASTNVIVTDRLAGDAKPFVPNNASNFVANGVDYRNQQMPSNFNGTRNGFGGHQYYPQQLQNQWGNNLRNNQAGHHQLNFSRNNGLGQNGFLGAQPVYGTVDQYGNFVPYGGATVAPIGFGGLGIPQQQYYGGAGYGNGHGIHDNFLGKPRNFRAPNQTRSYEINAPAFSGQTPTSAVADTEELKVDLGTESEDAAEFVMEGTQTSLPSITQNANTKILAATQPVTPGGIQQQVPCHFGDNCTRPQCPFLHSWQVLNKSKLCRFGDACRTLHCTYWHSWDGGEPPAVQTQASLQSFIPCRFGTFCTKVPNCPFKHESNFTGNKTLVLNNMASVSERTFAVADEETEKVLGEGVAGTSGMEASGVEGGVTEELEHAAS
ncbi:transcriptional repressor general negative regulator of transcription subunit 4 [Physocladia obscura]|uniref:Transcriptional repressor general negative regulator of transcription subunit 4 n=1 Tax=Physocladia obscura TaxID=109957 RepID=A0AAD5XLH8_9FUNG|nr:transcriptional repressor general negative regulator of transcription subunit 4 [Physocladia obscura]